MEEVYSQENPQGIKAYLSTRPKLAQSYATVSIGLCATVELENTLSLAERILKIDDPQVNVQEVIVATPNRSLALRLERRDTRLIVLLESKREGKTSALNKIISRATGDILIIASADIKMSRDAIPKLVKALVDHKDWGLADSRVQMADGNGLLMDKVNCLLWAVHNATLDDLDYNERLAHAGDMFAVRRNLIGPIPNITNDDAHVALGVQRKGFKIKRVPSAVVWITGPTSPADYVTQRTRILQGHLELIRRFRTAPTTFEFSMSSRPLRNIRLLLKTLSKLGLRYIPALATALCLEFFSFQLAVLRTMFSTKNKPWRLALTTKPA